MMSLSGYRKTTGIMKGGIEKIALAKVEWIEKAEFDCKDTVCTDIKMKDGYNFCQYEFCEGKAQYNEEIKYQDGIHAIKHFLSFSIPKTNSKSNDTIREILNSNITGLAAVILTSSDECLLIGISRKMGNEKPLRLVSVSASTGYEYSDDPIENILLQSEDIDKAAYFAGKLNIL